MAGDHIELITKTQTHWVVMKEETDSYIHQADIYFEEGYFNLVYRNKPGHHVFSSLLQTLQFLRRKPITDKPVNHSRKQWGYDAMYCYLTNQDCENCSLNLNYNFNLNKKVCNIAAETKRIDASDPDVHPTWDSFNTKHLGKDAYKSRAVRQGVIRHSEAHKIFWNLTRGR